MAESKWVVREEFRILMDERKRYMQHLRHCEIDNTEFCTCGLGNWRERYNAELKHIKRYEEEPDKSIKPPEYITRTSVL